MQLLGGALGRWVQQERKDFINWTHLLCDEDISFLIFTPTTPQCTAHASNLAVQAHTRTHVADLYAYSDWL